MRIYFDNAATTQVSKPVSECMVQVMGQMYGNPSSLHTMGMESEKAMEAARGQLAAAMKVEPACLYFTSGGTESDNLAVLGGARRNARGRKKILVSAAEHPAVAQPCAKLAQEGFEVCVVRIGPDGLLDLNHLESLADEQCVLATLMQVNNETGCIMPLKEAVEILRKKAPRALIHSDMVQALGKTDMAAVDMASVSGHKIHGSKGVGALYLRKGVQIDPLVYGGGQERDIRPGTQNVPGIAGFGAAAEQLRPKETAAQLAALKGQFLRLLEQEDIPFAVNGEGTVPHIVNISFEGAKAEVLLHILEANGIMVSSGSACASNKPSPSPVLTAMGLPRERIDSAVRFSFSEYNTIEEAEYCVQVIKRELPALRKMTRR